MSDSLNAQTFDVADMFTGAAYPTDTIPFYTNPAIAYQFHKLSEEAKEAVKAKDENLAREVEEKREELIRKSERFRYEIHIRGASRDNRRAIQEGIQAEYPEETDLFGRTKANPEADEKYANRMWALHIEKIVRPDGAILVSLDESGIKVIRGNAPDSEIANVEAAIHELSEGAKSGFESLAQEHDFLSKASSEA